MLSPKRITILFCLIPLFLIFTGCGKKEMESGVSDTIKPEGQMLGENKGKDDTEADSFSAGDLESLDKSGNNPLAEDTTSLAYRQAYGRSTAPLTPVYFDFDSSAINADQLDSLNESGRYLAENKPGQLVVEGNCDNRGTVDYNLALGELRAINVKKYLVNIGIDETRIKTISFGSERPLFHGNDEESWAANRRADLVLP